MLKYEKQPVKPTMSFVVSVECKILIDDTALNVYKV